MGEVMASMVLANLALVAATMTTDDAMLSDIVWQHSRVQTFVHRPLLQTL